MTEDQYRHRPLESLATYQKGFLGNALAFIGDKVLNQMVKEVYNDHVAAQEIENW